MKKTVSLLILIGMVMLMFIPTVSAAEEARFNVMGNAMVGITQGLSSNSKYIPSIMWDGINVYNADIAGTYCDFKMTAGKTAIKEDTATKYSIYGDEGTEDSIYYATFEIVLDGVYMVDSFKFYGAVFGGTANIDGFDIWVSETGEDKSYTKVVSVTELLCGSKYENHIADGLETVMYSADFDPIPAQYVVFGLSQPRCLHAEELAKIGLEPNANPHYFRITELELYGVATEPKETTTAAPETTTAAPVVEDTTTAEPVETTTATPVEDVPAETTAAPTPTTQAPTTEAPKAEGGCGSTIALAILPVIALTGVALVSKKRK